MDEAASARVPPTRPGAAPSLCGAPADRPAARGPRACGTAPFDEWTEMFGSERLTGALLDRLTHHVDILEMNGDSYRLKHSRKSNQPRATGAWSRSFRDSQRGELCQVLRQKDPKRNRAELRGNRILGQRVGPAQRGSSTPSNPCRRATRCLLRRQCSRSLRAVHGCAVPSSPCRSPPRCFSDVHYNGRTDDRESSRDGCRRAAPRPLDAAGILARFFTRFWPKTTPLATWPVYRYTLSSL